MRKKIQGLAAEREAGVWRWGWSQHCQESGVGIWVKERAFNWSGTWHCKDADKLLQAPGRSLLPEGVRPRRL